MDQQFLYILRSVLWVVAILKVVLTLSSSLAAEAFKYILKYLEIDTDPIFSNKFQIIHNRNRSGERFLPPLAPVVASVGTMTS